VRAHCYSNADQVARGLSPCAPAVVRRGRTPSLAQDHNPRAVTSAREDHPEAGVNDGSKANTTPRAPQNRREVRVALSGLRVDLDRLSHTAVSEQLRQRPDPAHQARLSRTAVSERLRHRPDPAHQTRLLHTAASEQLRQRPDPAHQTRLSRTAVSERLRQRCATAGQRSAVLAVIGRGWTARGLWAAAGRALSPWVAVGFAGGVAGEWRTGGRVHGRGAAEREAGETAGAGIRWAGGVVRR
jgi:hypothetical protein